MIPFFGCDREYMADQWEYLRIANEVLSSGRWLQGDPVRELEDYFSSKFSRHAVVVGSCTDALYLALRTLNIGPGDEVLVPAFSFLASATCILRAGATPILVDVSRETGLIDLREAAAKVTLKTKALIFVHLYGNMIDPDWFRRDFPDIVLIEDAAQAFGSYLGVGYAGHRPAGTLGDISCFSFDPTKTISAPGSGGMVLTKEGVFARVIRALRHHGKIDGEYVELGYNSQMSTLAAAFVLHKVRQDKAWSGRRREIARAYVEGFDGHFMWCTPGCSSNNHKFVLLVPHRNQFRLKMDTRGVETKVHYSQSLNQLPMFDGVCPNAEYLADHVVSLPIHPFLTHEEVDQVINAVNSSLKL